MKEGDKVEFNEMAPAYLVKQLGSGPNTIIYIDNDNWVFLKEDQGNPRKMLAKNWLKVVREA